MYQIKNLRSLNGSSLTFTIITSTYNAEKSIKASIESIIPYVSEDIEYIVIDGNSTDNTKEIIKQYLPYISYYISEPDEGIYDAWNKALSVAR